jgi:L-ascorbate metabolism protein UlaG (beta-lactamase superfamily)
LKIQRRTVIGGLAAGSLAGAGTLAYRAAPNFWHQYWRELERPVHPAPGRPQPRSWPNTGLHAAWLGHSTVLLKIDGFTIITDPALQEKVGLSFGPVTLGLKRLIAPALRVDEMPHIDLILLSHAHMDHLDKPTLRALESRKTAVLMASKTSDLFRADRYGSVRELAWGERARVGPAEVRAFEVNHWGARMRTDTYRGYNGYLIETGSRRLLFAGDTAITAAFRALRTSKPIDLAIMPVGAYNPWIHVHCNPEQALAMSNDAGVERILPVHHQTFSLSREPLHEPMERLYAAVGRDTDRIVMDQIGREVHL